MRIATWNVNSIRARKDRVLAWLDRSNTDVLAIQETKCKPEQFPLSAFEDAGYEVCVEGLNQWNGVAIASRVGMEDVTVAFPHIPEFGDPPVVEPRSISAVCGGVHVTSVYVPNGRELDHPHYHYKLRWFEALTAHVKSLLADDADRPLMVAGDFNVAPHDEDVWDPAFFETLTHTSDDERAAFVGLLDAGLTDVVRPHAPGPGVYTFWDYTQLRFPKKQGMRIDFALASDGLAKRVEKAHIDRDERKGKGASDHTPVVVDITD